MSYRKSTTCDIINIYGGRLGQVSKIFPFIRCLLPVSNADVSRFGRLCTSGVVFHPSFDLVLLLVHPLDHDGTRTVGERGHTPHAYYASWWQLRTAHRAFESGAGEQEPKEFPPQLDACSVGDVDSTDSRYAVADFWQHLSRGCDDHRRHRLCHHPPQEGRRHVDVVQRHCPSVPTEALELGVDWHFCCSVHLLDDEQLAGGHASNPPPLPPRRDLCESRRVEEAELLPSADGGPDSPLGCHSVPRSGITLPACWVGVPGRSGNCDTRDHHDPEEKDHVTMWSGADAQASALFVYQT